MNIPRLNISGIKIVTKIVLSFVIIIILSILTSGFLLYKLGNSDTTINNLYYNSIVLNKVYEIESVINNIAFRLNYINDALQYKDIDLAMSVATKSTIKLSEIEYELNNCLEDIKNIIKDVKGKIFVQQAEEWFVSWQVVAGKIVEQIDLRNFSDASQTISEADTKLNDFRNAYLILKGDIEQSTTDAQMNSKQTIAKGIIISFVISAVLIVIAILISIFLSRNIYKSLSFFRNVFSRGASGDLDARYPVRLKANDELNELGKFFNNFMDKVRGVIKEVVDVSNDLGASSEEVSVTINSFAENSQNQAASSEEITATMEEISAGVDNVSDNSQFQFNTLNDFISLMKELSDMINSMAQRINEAQGLSQSISDQAKAGNESLSLMDMIMNKITESSNKVSEIVDIIDDISNRINLLSLNAAIEAARAGEAGRGFAVVADEISKLADQTATSISDIDSLINQNKNEITNGMKNVLNTVDNITRVIEGVESIDNMMSSIFVDMGRQQSTNESVNKSAEDLRIRSEEVKNASEEQRTAVSEIMKSITNINDLIQASAGGAEEMSANVNRLASMAENLKDRVSFFKV